MGTADLAAGFAAVLGLAFSEPSFSDLVEDFAFFAGLASALACLVSAAGFDLASAVDLDFVVGFLSFSLLAVDSLLPVAWATVECATGAAVAGRSLTTGAATEEPSTANRAAAANGHSASGQALRV